LLQKQNTQAQLMVQTCLIGRPCSQPDSAAGSSFTRQIRLKTEQHLTAPAIVCSWRVSFDFQRILQSPACFWEYGLLIVFPNQHCQCKLQFTACGNTEGVCDDVDVCRSPGTLPCCMLRMVSGSTLSTQAMSSQMCMVRTLLL